MEISKVIKKPEANYFFSFVIGLGVAVLMFHRPQSEIDVCALPMEELKKMITRVDGKCYRYRVEDASCPVARLSL
jgi:hypothetical protein